jgi:hypothetical protein
MGSDNFFAKLASVDPLAQSLDLPGAHKYAQYEAEHDMPASTGPYAGMAPSLAGANAGYAPGGPGSNPNYVTPTAPKIGGGFFGGLQRFAGSVPTVPNPGGGNYTGTVSGNSAPGAQNGTIDAANSAPNYAAGMAALRQQQPQQQRPPMATTQPVRGGGI